MNNMSFDYLDALASDDLTAREEPLFPVFGYAGLKKLPEIDRQRQFINLMRALAPGVMLFANGNAGKRNPARARKEGVTAGVFDMTACWKPRRTAYLEFKGFDKSGRAGKLSRPQIDWGNAMHRLGHDVACFYDPFHALDWLRQFGCPVRDAR